MGYNINDGGNISFNINSKNSAVREKGLQNKVVDNILKVTRSPKNQINLHMPIDLSPAHNAADNSEAGEVVKHVTSDNPLVKYMMQVQNMVGKEVIGITAVSIKAFFAATYYFNDWIRQFEEELSHIDNDLTQITETVYKYLKDLLVINPIDQSVTCYANLNFDSLIRLVESNTNLANFVIDRTAISEDPRIQNGLKKKDDTPLTLLELLNTLRTKAMSEDACLNLSSLLSAATDNAKELILSKINATSKFVDIYTYLFTLGNDFNTIANIMKSPIFNEVVKLTETNIFDSTTSQNDLQKALDFYIDLIPINEVDRDVWRHLVPSKAYKLDELPWHDDDKKGKLYKTLAANSNKPIYIWQLFITAKSIKATIPSRILRFYRMHELDNKQEIQKALNKAYNIRRNLKSKVDPLTQQQMIDEERQKIADNPRLADKRSFILELITRNEIDNTITHLENILDRYLFLESLGPTQEQSLALLNMIRYEVLPATEEQQILGAQLGVNQGLKTNNYDQFSFIRRIENFYKNRGVDLNLIEFLTNDSYRNQKIQQYDELKSTNNPLKIISTVPHFKAMFDTIALNDGVLNTFSSTYVLTRLAAKYLSELEKPIPVGSKEFQIIKNTIEDTLILQGIKSMNLSIKLPEGFKYMKGTLEPTETAGNDTIIPLDNNINVANFKKLMDEELIPLIIRTFPDTPFTKALTRTIKETKDSKQKFYWRLNLQMMNVDDTLQTQTMYGKILQSFDELANENINGWRLSDLFYLYNLVTNKDSFGNDAFTRLFENLSTSKNRTNLVNQFYQFLSEVDNDPTMLKFHFSNVVNNVSPSETPIKILDPKYFTFDLMFDDNGGYYVLLDPVGVLLPTDDQSHFKPTVTSYDVLVPLINKINQTFETNIHIVTNAETSETASAYIEDGELYINVDKADITDIIHEIGHCIFAIWKKEDPELYYATLETAKNNPSFQEIAAAYSDKHGSDLYEEVFLKQLQSELRGYFYSKDQPLIHSLAGNDLLTIVSRLLVTYVNAPKTTDFRGATQYLIEAMLSQVVMEQTDIDPDIIRLSQKVATWKDNLVKDQSLKEDCSQL